MRVRPSAGADPFVMPRRDRPRISHMTPCSAPRLRVARDQAAMVGPKSFDDRTRKRFDLSTSPLDVAKSRTMFLAFLRG